MLYLTVPDKHWLGDSQTLDEGPVLFGDEILSNVSPSSADKSCNSIIANDQKRSKAQMSILKNK